MAELHDFDVSACGQLLRCGKLSSVELTHHALDRIAGLDSTYNAFITVTAERALQDAARADAELKQGIGRGPLHGIPYAIKDVIATKGIRTTCASRVLLDHVPTEDAAAAVRMREAGGTLLGKLMTYEFATAGPSFDLAFPAAVNPRAMDRITGGSSSGCAAAIAAGMVRVAVGTDGGGSARSPASYCGIVGLKPTYGRVSTHGLFPLAPSLDHVGPMGATVEDVAICLDALSDPAMPRAHVDLNKGIQGLRIGYARSWTEGADASVIAALEAAVVTLEKLGARVEDVTLPDYSMFEAAYIVIMQAEAFAVHKNDLKNKSHLYGVKAFQNLVTGTILSATDLADALKVKARLTAGIEHKLRSYDALLVVNTHTPALALSEFKSDKPRWTEMRTLPFNVSGHPALAVPMGVDNDGLPLGLQFVGARMAEGLICRIGKAFEDAIHLRLRFPQMPATQGHKYG